MTSYIVIYRTATHIGHTMHADEAEARQDEHLSTQWNGRLYSISDAEGFSGAEAKDLYNHGAEAMSPAWGIAEIEVE